MDYMVASIKGDPDIKPKCYSPFCTNPKTVPVSLQHPPVAPMISCVHGVASFFDPPETLWKGATEVLLSAHRLGS